MIHENIVVATFDRSNMSQFKISRVSSIGRDRQKLIELIDRACFDSKFYTFPSQKKTEDRELWRSGVLRAYDMSPQRHPYYGIDGMQTPFCYLTLQVSGRQI